jgi:hypothetical protein
MGHHLFTLRVRKAFLTRRVIGTGLVRKVRKLLRQRGRARRSCTGNGIRLASLWGFSRPLEEQLDGMAVDPIALHDEADKRIVQQLGQRKLSGRNLRQGFFSVARRDGVTVMSGLAVTEPAATMPPFSASPARP